MSTVFESGIRPAVDAYLKKKREEVRDYGDYWSASSAGYCMRKNIFERLKVPHVEKDGDDRVTRVFEAGHIFHEWMQRITKDAALSIASEMEVIDDSLMIKGHFDDLCRVNGKLILYDYKTANSKWFEYVKHQPMSHYNKYQLATYIHMLRKEYPELVEGRICKISKDDLRMHEIVLTWSPEVEKEVVGYWRTLNGYWDSKQLPKCTCADFEVNKKTGRGFMADPKYNPFFFNNEPCSLDYLAKFPKLLQAWKES